MSTTSYSITNGDATIYHSGMDRAEAFRAAQQRANEHGEPFWVAPELGDDSDDGDDSDLGEQVDPLEQLECYAVVDAPAGHVGEARVAAVHRSSLDAGDAALDRAMTTLARGRAWVWVDGGCAVGDTLEIDSEGCATAL